MAVTCDKAAFQRRESKHNGETFAGLEYDTELAGSEGVRCFLFATETTTPEQLAAAEAEARQRRDVVDFITVRVPQAWLDEEAHQPAAQVEGGWLPAVRWIAEHWSARRVVPETGELVPEDKRGGMLLDAFSASGMLQVYEALSAPARATFQGQDLRVAHSIAFKLLAKCGK